MTAISDKLKLAYEAKGLSYQELSKLCKVPQATIQRYVMGLTSRIDIDKLQAICDVLEVDAEDVVGWKNGSKNADLDERFGTALKKERIRLNWSLEKMAAELGTSPDILRAYERGERIPKFATAVIWAIQLGIPLNAYDSQLLDSRQESESDKLDLEIIRLIGSLSEKSRAKALAYIQGLKDNEDNP